MTGGAMELLQIIVSNFTNVLVAVVGYFLVRTLNQMDESLQRMRKDHEGLRHDHNEHNTRIARLEGFQEGVKIGRGRAEREEAAR
jgi:Tfp pilus assembly protein PilO